MIVTKINLPKETGIRLTNDEPRVTPVGKQLTFQLME